MSPQVKQLKTKLENAKSVALFGHISPDGDCLGSLFAFYNMLKDNDKDVDIYIDDKIPNVFSHLFDTSLIKNENIDKTYDLYLSVDCSDAYRMGAYGSLFNDKNDTIAIDHHFSCDTTFSKLCILDAFASSACEVIYSLFKKMNINISNEIATALYTGIATDTGSFKFTNVSSITMQYAGELLDLGADAKNINKYMFGYTTYSQLDLQKILYNSIELFNKKIALAIIPNKVIKSVNAQKGDTETFSNTMLAIEDVCISAIATEFEPKSFKCSIRSEDEYNSCNVAKEFGGGGHKHASGCLIGGSVESVKKDLYKACMKEIERCEEKECKE